MSGVDARLAVRATGLLATFNVAGVIDAADVHVATRLGRLTGERDESVLLAVSLAVRGARSGSVCVTLEDAVALATAEQRERAADGAATGAAGVPDDGAGPGAPDVPALPWPDPAAWRAAIERSPTVAVGPDGDPARPVRWVDGRLYLDRYWRDEQVVRTEVDARLHADPFPVDPGALRDAVERLLHDLPAREDLPHRDLSRQRLAAATAALSPVTVLTGGPGTGKTTTVARLLAVLRTVVSPDLRVAVAAPTGKAAARLTEALHEAAAHLGPADAAMLLRLEATTLHRLLGWLPGSSTRFRHDRTRRLPHDVVVVDETSMVSLTLMARLLEALRPQARLVLVGDPDQLASVEAGAVLGDLVARPPVADALPGRLAAVVPEDVPRTPGDLDALRNGVVRLTERFRFGDVLGALADAIVAGDADAVVARLSAGDDAVEWVRTGERPTDDDVAGVRADVVATGVELVAAAAAADPARALRALGGHRLLLAHREGPAGVAGWADRIETWVRAAAAAQGVELGGAWPLGLPLVVTANDRDTGLYNGDTGVVVAERPVTAPRGAPGGAVVDDDPGRVVAFGDPDRPRLVRPHRLPAVQPVHAMTVHRAQGSQFGRVSVVLPAATSPLLTRELLYTAVTRARTHVRVVGSEEAVRAAVARPVRRASGLRAPR